MRRRKVHVASQRMGEVAPLTVVPLGRWRTWMLPVPVDNQNVFLAVTMHTTLQLLFYFDLHCLFLLFISSLDRPCRPADTRRFLSALLVFPTALGGAPFPRPSCSLPSADLTTSGKVLAAAL